DEAEPALGVAASADPAVQTDVLADRLHPPGVRDGDRVHTPSEGEMNRGCTQMNADQSNPDRIIRVHLRASAVHFFFCIFAHVSRSVTARLKTGLPGFESLSTQKYPSRSNWNLLPAGSTASP